MTPSVFVLQHFQHPVCSDSAKSAEILGATFRATCAADSAAMGCACSKQQASQPQHVQRPAVQVARFKQGGVSSYTAYTVIVAR